MVSSSASARSEAALAFSLAPQVVIVSCHITLTQVHVRFRNHPQRAVVALAAAALAAAQTQK